MEKSVKIAVLDATPLDADRDLDWTPLREIGDLTLHAQTPASETIARLAGVTAAYTNKVRLGEAEFAASPSLKFVSTLSTGFDIVDIAAARAHGVTVCNVPGYSTPSTAQTAIALLLELANHVGDHAAKVREGEWTRRGIWSWWNEGAVELDGKTLVIVGMGAIGSRVAAVASALGMNVIPAQIPGRSYPPDTDRVPLLDALRHADAVSLHCPLTPETRHLMNEERLALLKQGAFLINTGRGPLVDETAVAASLTSGNLGGYAADVMSAEPPSADNPLITAPRTILTPHYAWTSRSARERMLTISVANLSTFLSGTPQNVVS
jgi:glycerate dehydrogenase